MKIADVSIRRPIFALMLNVALVVFGVFAYRNVGVDLFPNVEFPFVTVTVTYPGADPESMEEKVAKPIEDAISSMAGIKVLQSVNLESVTQVIIQFELSVDRDQATQDVRDRISAIQSQLPDGVEPPQIAKLDLGAMPIMSVALSAAPSVSPRELTELADEVVKERIQRIPGVGNVDIVGGREREVHVMVDPAKLAARGLTPGDVVATLQAQNLDLPAGRLERDQREFVITTQGAFQDPAAILEAPIVSAPGGLAVRIADVATVDVKAMAEKRSHASLDGNPAVALVVQKESGSNTVAVARAVRDELGALERDLAAEGVKLVITNDSAPFIERSFHEVQFDLLLGGLLAILIIMVFLHDWRATFISALALPTSVVATVWFLNIMDFTFNQMTMLALSLSIGLLIDDAIVVIENIHRHLEKGESPMRAAANGTAEIGLAVLATTLSIVAVFAPVATMQGIIGRFFFQFGMTVSIAVLVSLFVSLTLTPMLASRMLRAHHGRAPNVVVRTIERVLDVVDRAYRRTLAWVLHARWSMAVTMVAAVILMIGSCGLAGQVKQEFVPEEDRSQFTIDVELPTGISLGTSTRVIEAIATDVRANAPRVLNTFVTIGQGAQGQVNIGKVQVNMVGPSARAFTQQDLMAWARQRYTPLSARGLKITVNQLGGVGGDSGFKSQAIQFALRSNDMPRLVAAAQALKAELEKHPGFVDVDLSYRGGKPQLEIVPDRHAAAEVGVPVAPIATALRALVARDKITDYKDGVDLYDVKLTLPPEVQSELASLSNLTVRSPAGALVPLDTLVEVVEGVGPSQIDRQDKQRQIMIYANLNGLVLGEATQLVEEAARRVVPRDVDTQMSGMGEVMAESFGYMIVALLLAIVLLYMILAAQFESLIHPFTIMMSLPLSVVGAFGALYFTGKNMSIFAMIGLIMLMGLVTKNAILLVDYTNQKKRDGLSTHDALLEAGPVRLRPILMTTAAMILGMLPVALALGEGGGTRSPMAVVVIGGLITSTMLTLIVVPIIYSFFEWLRTRFSRRRRPQAPPPPEPAREPESA